MNKVLELKKSLLTLLECIDTIDDSNELRVLTRDAVYRITEVQRMFDDKIEDTIA